MSKSTRKRKGEEIARLSSIEVKNYLSIGISNYNLGKFKEAIDNFIKVTALDTRNKSAFHGLAKSYFNLGILHFKKQDFIQAIENFGEVNKIEPNHITTNFYLGHSYLRLSRFSESIKHFGKVTALSPQYIDAYYALGMIYFKLGNFPEVIKNFGEVNKIKPNHITTNFYLGHSYLCLSKFSEATKHFEKVTALNPQYIDAYYALGEIYFKLGNFPEVIKNFGELIKLKPNHDEAHQVLGSSYLKIGDLYNAIMHFTKAASLNPLKFTDCYLTNLAKIKNPDFKNLTTISKSLHQVIASNETILKETADESTLSKVNFNIAEALAFLHKLGFSEESEFLKHAADYYFRCGTVVALEKIINHDPRDTLKLHYKAHYERGNIAFTNKDYNTALSYYEQVLKVMPSFIDAYIHASLSCIEIGKNGDGISILISERSSWYLSQARKYLPSLLKAIDEGLTEELDKSIKKPIEIVNLIFNYYVGDGGAEFVSGSEQVIKEVMGLVGEETSI